MSTQKQPRPKRRELRYYMRQVNCEFCKADKDPNYKEIEKLQEFITDRGKIVSSVKTGLCAKHQRRLAKSIKHARHLGLLPFTAAV